MTKLDSELKSKYHFAKQGLHSQDYNLSSNQVW